MKNWAEQLHLEVILRFSEDKECKTVKDDENDEFEDWEDDESTETMINTGLQKIKLKK